MKVGGKKGRRYRKRIKRVWNGRNEKRKEKNKENR